MCLMISKPKSARFDKFWLRDFWMRNQDGAGVMWTDDTGTVQVRKILSPSLNDWLAFYKEHAARRACLIHLRMRTHGDVTYENVHPYAIGAGVYLMHNGVLRFGNADDVSRSDTWHYIQKYLALPVTANPDVIYDWQFRVNIGRHIGKHNRFALLGPRGKPIIINYRTGYHFGGAWFSNTYAWSAGSALDLKAAA